VDTFLSFYRAAGRVVYEREHCDHSEAVSAGSKPGAFNCKELLVLGEKLARIGASEIREVWKIPHRLAPGFCYGAFQ